MTDQTTPTIGLPDHVAVTDAVVEQLKAYPIRYNHADGEQGEIPRYVAEEIGQAVIELVHAELPVSELTPVQYALLDALRDVALSSEAPGAEYAGKQVVRLTAAEFGNPVPEPVQREGGLAGFLYGRPIVPNPPEPEPVLEPWPFKPGTVVRDEDGAEEEWFRNAPVGTVIRDEEGYEQSAILTGHGLMWMPVTGVHSTPSWIATASPWTVVSVPDQEADRG